MDTLQILGFISVAALLVMSPGPNGLLIVKTLANSGKLAGFANIAGFVAAFYLHGSLSILGVSLLIVKSSEAFFIFKMLGAVYLFWIGIKSCIAAWYKQTTAAHIAQTPKTSVAKAFLEGFLTNCLNPKVSLFYLAAFPQFLPANPEIANAFTLVFIHASINILWFSAMILLIARVKYFMANGTFARYFKLFTGTVFIGFAIKLLILKPFKSQ